MVHNNPYNQYKENSIYTASPEELTMMLYNGLVKFLMQAKSSLEEKDIQKSNNSIIRAQDVIAEFQSTLDMKYEISHNLYALYDYMQRQLVQANVKKDVEKLEEVLGFAKELRDTWAEAMKIAKQNPNSQVHQQHENQERIAK